MQWTIRCGRNNFNTRESTNNIKPNFECQSIFIITCWYTTDVLFLWSKRPLNSYVFSRLELLERMEFSFLFIFAWSSPFWLPKALFQFCIYPYDEECVWLTFLLGVFGVNWYVCPPFGIIATWDNRLPNQNLLNVSFRSAVWNFSCAVCVCWAW